MRSRRGLGVLLGAALAVAACSGGGGTTAGTVAPGAASSTAVATTTVPDVPATRPIPSTTTTVPAAGVSSQPVAVGAYVNGREEPPLGTRDGWHLWLSGAGGFFVVDMDTGAISHVDAPAVFSQAYAVPGGLLYVTSGAGSVAVDAASATVRNLPNARLAFRASDPGRLWATTSQGLIEIGLDGTIRRSSGVTDAAGEVDGRLVVVRGGRTFLVDPADRTSTLWVIGEPTYVNRNRIVWRECFGDLTCRSWVGTAAEPRARAIEATDARCGVWYEGYHEDCDGSMSADGRIFLATDESRATAGLTVFEVAAAWKTRFPSEGTAGSMAGAYDGWVLSPDGRWALGARANGRIVARRVDEDRDVELDVVRPTEKGGVDAVLAIG